MAWLVLILAGGLEIGWAIGLKYTDGFTRIVPTIATVAGDGGEPRHCSASPCASCLSALHMPSGPALALSEQCCSACSVR